MKDVIRFLDALRASHQDMETVFTQGQCYNLFLLMRTVWPEAKAFYSMAEGHVYVEVGGAFFDIRGRHFSPPKDLAQLNHQRGDRPHRWGKRDPRRLPIHPR